MVSSLPWLSFGAPLALLALIGLPVLWWLLRATPPKPKREILPSFRLLEGLVDQEHLPQKTPWWLVLLRVLLVGLMVLALALPSQKANDVTRANIAHVLFVIDDGWTSAPYWQDMKNAVLTQIEALPQEAYVHFLLTSAKTLQTQPDEAFPVRQARAWVQTLEPVGWLPDRLDALTRLRAANIAPDRVYWFSDGLDARDPSIPTGSSALNAFSEALSIGDTPVVYLPKPVTVLRVLSAEFNQDQYDITLELNPMALGTPLSPTNVLALSDTGFSLGTAEVTFDVASGLGQASFDLPFTTAQRIARFKVNAPANAGNIWLNNLNEGPKFVGLVRESAAPQPLVTDGHYIENALPDNVKVQTGSVDTLLETPPSIIVLADGVRATRAEQTALLDWVKDGGLLVRFAAEDMGEELDRDSLISVAVRRQARNLGSALNWDTPQPVADFGLDTPFFGLEIDPQTRVTRQVLARATPDLARYTWASLADGSPLITTRKLGQGRIVFFHIGATPEWSNLVLSALFPAMWERLVGLAKTGVAPDAAEGQYTPFVAVDGFGRFVNPPDTASPLGLSALNTLPVSETHPAGFYRGPSGRFARNVGTGLDISPIRVWPSGAQIVFGFGSSALSLTAIFFLLCYALIVVEALVFVFFLMRPSYAKSSPVGTGKAGAGKTGFGKTQLGKTGAALIICISALVVFSPISLAQSVNDEDPQLATNLDAAMGLKLAYIPTGQARLDTQSERGLVGLSRILFLRTSVEPEKPHKLDLAEDALELYPLIYWPMPDTPTPLGQAAATKLNAYMRSGGALVIDTRSGNLPGAPLPQEKLARMLEGIDVPPLQRVPPAHVINRAFYLIDTYPGRFENEDLWVDARYARPDSAGVSPIFIGDADWASAWAIDSRGRSMASADGGRRGREFAYRFGVNLVMYALTGAYKSDQVHLPALIERLGEEADIPEFLGDEKGDTE